MHISMERKWMEWLLNHRDESAAALRIFAANYHYFSLHQAISFATMFSVILPTDRDALSMLASVLYDELGRGEAGQAHSILFERFAVAVGVDACALPLKEGEVLDGVRGYVEALREGFGRGSLPRALATYVFLEATAVETYAPLLQVLRELGFSEEALQFFSLHTVVEPQHAAASKALVARQRLSPAQHEKYENQGLILKQCWEKFWEDIYQASAGARHA